MFTLLIHCAVLLLSFYSSKALSNSTSILPYIIGDVINGNLIWNSTNFPNTNQLELILSYNKLGQKAVNISFGMVNNTGSLPKDFTPNFTSTAQHLLIPNNATGIFILKSPNKKSIKLNQYKYLLFQPILLNKNIGFTMNKYIKNSNNHIISVKGMIIQTIFNQQDFTFKIRLAQITNTKTYNIAFNKSLTITYTTAPPEKCDNVTIIGSSNITYCPFTVNITNQFDTFPAVISSNYYLLTATFSEKTTPNSNYFGINGFPALDTSQQVFVYSSHSSVVNMKNMTDGTAIIKTYQERDMRFTVDGSKTERIYAVLQDVKDNANEFVFDCKQHSIGYYDSFGWRFKSLSNKHKNIINGSYVLNLYMDYGQSENKPSNDKYMIYLNKNYKFNVTVYNDTSMKNIKIISVKNNGNILAVTKGKSKSFEFISAVNNGTNIDVYFEQCNNTNKGIFCNKYYPNNGKVYTFEYNVDNEIETIYIPNNKSLQLDDGTDTNITTKIVMNITLCDGNNIITTKQNISIITSSKKKDNLGEDEIVGIICASTIIAGLAVWILCLRHKNEDDGYKNLNH